jgi:hypothetical protein
MLHENIIAAGKVFLLGLISLAAAAFAQNQSDLEECRKHNLNACEKLGAFYMAKEDWATAFMIGEALCTKDRSVGCMFAGASLVAQGKAHEGARYLNMACDKFEPFACRSLGRLMTKSNDHKAAAMFFRRACFYGLNEMCTEMKSLKHMYSASALSILADIEKDCSDTQNDLCQTHLVKIEKCETPLAKSDCQLLAGQLSILFRAKLLQSEAKVALHSVYAAQEKYKNSLKTARYSHDLAALIKEQEQLPLNRYVVGFLQACHKRDKSSRKSRANSQELFPGIYKQLGQRAIANILSYFKKDKSINCTDGKIGFDAYAVGSLDPLNPTRLDVWKIDQHQQIVNVLDGLPLP